MTTTVTLYDGATPYDISGQAQSVSYRRGRSRELDSILPATGTIQLINYDRSFDPPDFNGDTSFGTIAPGMKVIVKDGAIVVATGYVLDWDHSWTSDRRTSVTIYLTDALGTLAGTALLEHQAADLQDAGARITAVLDRAEVGYLSGASYRDINPGVDKLQGDIVSGGTNALNYLQTVAKSDLGRLYVDRLGVLTFRSRHDVLGTTATAVFSVDTVTVVVSGSVQENSQMTNPYGVAVSGTHAFVANESGTDRLVVVNLATPESPAIVGSTLASGTYGGSYDIAISGNYAYMPTYNQNALRVVNISTPATPSLSGSVVDATDLLGAYGVAVFGSYVVVTALDTNRLTVVDVSTPASPSVTGSVAHADLAEPWFVAMYGDYAIVTSQGNDRVTVVDCSTPSAPSVVGSVTDATVLNGAYRVAIYGDHAVVTSYLGQRLALIDLSTPSSPSIAGSVQDATNLNRPAGLVIKNHHAIVGSLLSDTLTVVDIFIPTAPVVVASVVDATNLGAPEALAMYGDYVVSTDAFGNRLTTALTTGLG